MKKLLFFLCSLLFSVAIYGQNVTVDQTTFTIEQLVTDVLIDSPCANVSNVTSSTGSDFSDVNGIGYFQEPVGAFPFTEGIILASGDAALANGPNPAPGTPSSGAGGWPGDADLTTIAGVNTNNASIIEFDFVPIASDISFRFLMASEEYDMGSFECNFSDIFAFLLTDEAGVTTNLAVLPDTNLPILVTNVHPDNTANGAPCPGINEQFFSQYVAQNAPPVSYDGFTRSFTAMADVNPGETYHIKLAVADASDTALDTAVFLEAGSFNLGVDLGNDILLASGNALCDGETVTLDTFSPSATHTWYLGGVEIMGETGSTLDVTVPGEYSVDVVFSGSCQTSDSIIIEFVTNPIANLGLDLLECSGTGTAQFTLSQNDNAILGAQAAADYLITYHVSQADADNDVDALPNAYTNTSNPQTIYARIESLANSTCFDTSTFELQVASVTFDNPITDFEICDNDADGFAQFTLSDKDAEVAASANYALADVTITYHIDQPDADSGMNPLPNMYTNVNNPQIIYARLVDNNSTSCFGSIELSLIVNELPQVQNVTLEQCDEDGTPDGLTEYNLEQANTGIIVGGDTTGFTFTYYLTLADAQTEMNPQAASPFNNTVNPQIVYVRVQNDGTSCFSIAELTLDVTATDIGDVALETCDDDYDGIAEFTLSDADALILAGLPAGLTVAYYETASDAQLEENQLPNLYTNIVPGLQTIFIRVEDANNCFGIANMDLIVNPLPDNNIVADIAFCSDTPDVLTTIDLLQFNTQVLGAQNAADFTITYHESQGEADSNMNPLPSPYTNISNPQTIYVRVENNTTNCFMTFINFEILINSNPTVILPSALEVCDDGVPDGLTSIDLSVKNTEITGGNPNYSVSYYLTQADADAEVNALPIPYTNISNPQTVFVRVEDINTGCFSTTTLELIVEQAPIANTPMPLEYCDPDSDGFGVFTLTDADAEIIGGQVGLTVSYHETMADADNNVNPQMSPYNNIVAFNQTIYARVESATITTDCATIVELQLIVYDTPAIEENLTPLEVCDDNADGFAQFNLTSKDTEVLNGLDAVQYTVTYYETQVNAETPVNPIVNTASYTNVTVNMQTIWVRVDDTATGCFKITTLDLIVNELPVLQQPSALELCDYTAPLGDGVEPFTLEDASGEILNGQTGISLTFYETQADADAEINPINSPYNNITNPQTIYVRAENDVTGCYDTITLDLRVNPIPSPAVPDPLEVCDDDNDGFAEFDLELRTLEIINGELDIVITYHETQANADDNIDPLMSPYMNIMANTQTVYARAENTVTGCFNTTELILIVLPSPEVPLTIAPYIICDDDNDGIAQFDLTTKNDEILGTQLPADFTLTYHLTEADADSGANPIANVTNYTNISNPQTIWVRLVSNTNACVTTGQFDLEVALPPVPVQPTPLELCDDELPGEVPDEMVAFDLTVKDTEITGGEASWVVTYYETDAAAQAGMPVIDPATAYVNTSVSGNPSNPQTLYVRVEDTDTGCFAFTTLTIRVLPIPTPNLDPPNLELCDDIATGDGVEEFDLTANEAFIINNELGVTASYYETQEDAEMAINAIVDPTLYSNISNPQTIYVRITNGDDPQGTNGTGCYAIVTFDLIVNELANVTGLDVEDLRLIACEFDGDDTEQFNLEENTAALLELIEANGQNASDFVVTYHEQQADAQANMNAIGNPTAYTNLSNPQTIYVNITDSTTGCDLATVSFEIEVQDGALADNPLMEYVICDNIGGIDDGLAQFNLTGTPNGDGFDYGGDLYAEILAGQNPADFTITFYESLLAAESGDVGDQIPFTYENTTNPQTIYIRVDNDTLIDDGMGNMVDSSICYATAEMVLRVEPLPVFDLDDEYLLCTSTNGSEVVVTPPTLDTGLSAPTYSFEWTDAIGTVLGTDGTYVPTQGGTYTVTVTNVATGCESSDSAIVNESSPATITATVVSPAFAENHAIEVIASTQSTVNDIAVYEVSINDGPWEEMVATGGTFTFTLTDGIVIGDNIIRVRDINGCGEADLTITVLDYPLYFTPNGDGINETWNIAGIANQPNAKIYIFDRFGKLLKQISPTSRGWNGTYNGELMPSNDYWFTVQYNEPNTGARKEFKAHFTLKR